MIYKKFLLTAYFSIYSLTACAADTPPDQGFGPNPVLPAPDKSLLPRMHTAKAIGWPQGVMPVATDGLQVNAFASDLQHPRWLYVLPNGDVLVAETDTPTPHDQKLSITSVVEKQIMKGAGSSKGSPNKIILLRDKDGDGVAETKTVFLEGLNSPFGMALVGNDLYVADTDAILKFPYKSGDTQISAKGVKLIDLPAGKLNHHWTKNIIASKDGTKLYATVGSNSNAGENGLDVENGRAEIMEIDLATGKSRPFATGLRNPNGLGWNPISGELWTAANERDELGNNLVPDYMTSVKDGAFYGWPYSYYGQHIDDRVKPQNPDMVAKAIAPDYALGNHTASLGLTFDTGDLFPAQYKNGVFIGQHGSWNRDPKSGYKVVFIPFKDGKPDGMPEDILTGFLDKDDQAQGRPVGVVIDKTGALLTADDVGNTIWRVVPKKQ